MSDNRVQKLLFSEYSEFEDMVLIESPFAQTTKDGRGIRQVHLGLTPTKLVLATDVLPPVDYVSFKYCPGVDPLIETFELVAVYPVECVNLSVYRTKRSQALKARFCNNKVLYFELGGFENRAMFWNLWCEKVKFFCPNGSGSSRSETSVGTSTTASTLYLLDRKLVAVNGMKQLWFTFGPNPSLANSSVNEIINSQYAPLVQPPSIEEFLHGTKSAKSSKLAIRNQRSETTNYAEENNLSVGDSVQINRFGSGVKEGCNIGLYLTVDDYVVPRRYSSIIDEQKAADSNFLVVNYEHLAESCVLAWELCRSADPSRYKIKHKRRYGLLTQPTLLYGYGVLEAPKGCKYSLQMKRAVSEVSLFKAEEPVLKTAVPKKVLVSSASHRLLTEEFREVLVDEKPPFTYFWTPGYAYRPKTPKQVYDERLKELKAIEIYQETVRMKRKRKRKKLKNLLCLYQNKIHKLGTDEESNDEAGDAKKRKKQGFIHNIFPYSSNLNFNRPNETPLQHLKRILKVDVNVCAWEFDSLTLAQQLTMIDKQLFLKIPAVELDVLIWQNSSNGAPNIASVLAFSRRISNLFAHEIVKNDCVKARARLIARFINVADKCHKFSNFQSCKSVLNGLQSPAVYRLRATWAYLRKHHASKYRNFAFLCRFYRDTRMLSYQKTIFIVSHSPPFLPYIGDIINRLLGKIPEYSFPRKKSSIAGSDTKTNRSETITGNRTDSIFHRFLKALALSQTNEVRETANRARKKYLMQRKKIRFKGLYEYYTTSGLVSSEGGKEEKVMETKAYLERCQLGAMSYNFRRDEMARCYLLKARYKEDGENFSYSLSIESPCNYYEPNTK
ncbi:unnamed protein product [Phyllotreta striolata]|uniref:Ras-GEF domain-containing protein n=1 Tax=Phyllotreta striolata TaxID=444603 RepID=A0A9N9XSJ7_PHYSR|nr:unnamed protein product [Phyllotreta striolata]